jgi:hypothetical protein
MMREIVVLKHRSRASSMAVNKKNKLSKLLLFIEIVLYITIACGMAYAIIN